MSSEAIEELEEQLEDRIGQTVHVYTVDGSKTFGTVSEVDDEILFLSNTSVSRSNNQTQGSATALIPLNQITIVQDA